MINANIMSVLVRICFASLLFDLMCACVRAFYVDDYSTDPRLLITCKFHKEALRQDLKELADQAPSFIDKEIGRVHTNDNEGGYATTWRSKMKGETPSHDAWRVTFGRGNLEYNQSAMNMMRGTHEP